MSKKTNSYKHQEDLNIMELQKCGVCKMSKEDVKLRVRDDLRGICVFSRQQTNRIQGLTLQKGILKLEPQDKMTRELYVYSTRICWKKLLSRIERTEEKLRPEYDGEETWIV